MESDLNVKSAALFLCFALLFFPSLPCNAKWFDFQAEKFLLCEKPAVVEVFLLVRLSICLFVFVDSDEIYKMVEIELK